MTEDDEFEGDVDGGRGTTSEFWADEAARRVAEAGRPPVVKGGVSPSGVPHIGNFNEIARGYFVARALERLAHSGDADFTADDVRQVFTSDDRDPLRRVPSYVVDADGDVVELPEGRAEELEQHIGRPYVDVPAPFGTAESWAEHFTGALARDADALGIDVEMRSNDAMYAAGEFDEAIGLALERLDVSRDVISEHQASASDDYVPYMARCERCGRITATVTSFDLDSWEASYVCVDADLGGEHVEGCGHEGVCSLRDGKLPWRFEWPAQWMALDVGFEPFGKDHAEGSWPSGVEIAERVYDVEPPEPLVYEFFLVEGAKMSASEGNVYTVDELLDVVEPEVLLYFFSLNPSKQRDFRPSEVDHLVNEFDRVEAVRRGDIEAADPEEALYAERVYPDVGHGAEPPRRPPYSFAAMVGVAEDDDARLDVLRRSGHLSDDASERDVEASLRRIELARTWSRWFDNEYDVRVVEGPPDVEFDDTTREAFADVADVVESSGDPDEIQNAIFEAAREHDVDVGGFFADGYRLFLGRDSGPKLGPLLAALDEELVVERLRTA